MFLTQVNEQKLFSILSHGDFNIDTANFYNFELDLSFVKFSYLSKPFKICKAVYVLPFENIFGHDGWVGGWMGLGWMDGFILIHNAQKTWHLIATIIIHINI